MKRLGFVIVLSAVAALTAGVSFADLPRHSSEGLARATAGQAAAPARKLVASIRGEALVEVTAPDSKIGRDEVVTTFRVKNISRAPIAGFRVQENWFKGNDAIAGDSYRHLRPLQVGEVIPITLKTPRARIVGARNQYQFSHANGTIKATTVKRLDLPKPPTE
jgi:hypothetical protein